MISNVDGSSMPKFCWMKNGSRNSASTSRQMNALSYSPRMMEDTSVASTISRRTRYTANTTGWRRMVPFRSRGWENGLVFFMIVLLFR